MSSIDPIIRFLAIEWIKAFRNAPIITGIITSIIAGVLSSGLFYMDKIDKQKREEVRLESLNYKTQIEQLEQTENGIKQLIKFIEQQKLNIQESEDTVRSLKKEQKALKPIVESDKAVVDAIFQAQEKRNRKNIWRERWIGFGFGIVASLVASFIWFVIRLWGGENKNA